MPLKKPLPELYAYLLRNMMYYSKENHVITSEDIFKSFKKVVYKSPRSVYRKVVSELMSDYSVLSQLNRTNFRINLSKEVRRQLDDLNDHIFPVSV